MSKFLETGWRLRRRPRNLPPYWQNVTPPPGIVNYVQRRDWQLVLNAAGIPFILLEKGQPGQLYVPPLWSERAKMELARFMEENQPSRERHTGFRGRKGSVDVLFFLVPLMALHALNSGWWIGPAWLPGKDVWTSAGALDGFRILFHHQWERVFTALTLHADLRHLSGNVLFGGLFLVILARIAGPGRAILLSILAGALGNSLSVLLHVPAYRSIGFSTAIFAALGATSGIATVEEVKFRKVLLSLGGALGLLALLGMEGENSDWSAHLFGLGSGFLLGVIYGFRAIRKKWLPGQTLASFGAIFIMACAWLLAFHGLGQ